MQSIEWRPVVGFEDTYEVSSDGQVRNIRTGFSLNPGTSPTGYKVVGLSKNGVRVQRFVHRVMNIAFNGEPQEGWVTRHLDGNPSNNVLSNIRWGTQKENVGDAIRHGTMPARSLFKESPDFKPRKKNEFCRRGHEYAEVGFNLTADGYRSCIECEKIRATERYERVFGQRSRPHKKLSESDISDLRSYARNGLPVASIASRFGISNRYARTLIAGKKRPA